MINVINIACSNIHVIASISWDSQPSLPQPTRDLYIHQSPQLEHRIQQFGIKKNCSTNSTNCKKNYSIQGIPYHQESKSQSRCGRKGWNQT